MDNWTDYDEPTIRQLLGRSGQYLTRVRRMNKKTLLYLMILIFAVAWLWPALMPKDLYGSGHDDPHYSLTFWQNGRLDASYANQTLFKIRWKVKRGEIILTFPAAYTSRISRFFGIDAKEVRKALKEGDSIALRKDGEPIYVRSEKTEYGWLAEIVPLKGLKYRYEGGEFFSWTTSTNPERLMIGKRVFARTAVF